VTVPLSSSHQYIFNNNNNIAALYWRCHGATIGRASDLRFIDRGFESCHITTAQWPRASYLHLHASVVKQYNLVPVIGQWRSEAGKVTVGLAMCYRLCRLSTYGLKAHVREMSIPPQLTIGHDPPLLVLPVLDLANTKTGNCLQVGKPQYVSIFICSQRPVNWAWSSFNSSTV